MTPLQQELTRLLNGHENDSNTPDWLLAQYLQDCLATWNRTMRARDEWYGMTMIPGRGAVRLADVDGPWSVEAPKGSHATVVASGFAPVAREGM